MFAPVDRRSVGRWALLSGLLALVAFGLLVAALIAPTPSDTRRDPTLFRWQDAGVIIQSLSMIPVVIGLRSLFRDHAGERAKRLLILALFALAALIISSALIFTHTAFDGFYMLPQGLLGLWLILINRPGDGPFSKGVAWTGRVAGFGLVLIGVGFLIYALFVAPEAFVRPLSDQEIDAQSWTTANITGHICMAAGTLLGRAIYPFWLLLLGAALLKNNPDGQADLSALRAREARA